jgi:hypothetical protein
MVIVKPSVDYEEIQLGNGIAAIIDTGDFGFLNQWKWGVSKSEHKLYARRSYMVNGVSKNILMHRLILEHHDINIAGLVVDHIDGNTLNNRLSNLRPATNTENCRNSKGHSNRSSKYKCVFPNGKDGWMSYIMVNRKRIYLGTYGTPEEAALAYNKAAINYFGEFACLNDLPDDIEISSPVTCLICNKQIKRDAKHPYCVTHRHLRPGYRGRNLP